MLFTNLKQLKSVITMHAYSSFMACQDLNLKVCFFWYRTELFKINYTIMLKPIDKLKLSTLFTN